MANPAVCGWIVLHLSFPLSCRIPSDLGIGTYGGGYGWRDTLVVDGMGRGVYITLQHTYAILSVATDGNGWQ